MSRQAKILELAMAFFHQFFFCFLGIFNHLEMLSSFASVGLNVKKKERNTVGEWPLTVGTGNAYYWS